MVIGRLAMPPLVTHRNEAWSRALDGRAVWGYLLWIEPNLAERGVADDLGAAVRARGLEELAVSAPADDLIVTLPPEERWETTATMVVGRWDGAQFSALPPEARATMVESLQQARRLGFGFLFRLAASVVALAAPDVRLDGSSAVAWADPAADHVQCSIDLVTTAARCFGRTWADVERRSRDDLVLHDDLVAEAIDVYGSSVARELARRALASGEPGGWTDHLASLDAWTESVRDRMTTMLDGPLGASLTFELIAYTFPGWDRPWFCLHSPFDALRQLPRPADAHIT